MKKIRCFFATIALVATLSGLLPLGTGLASMANTVSSLHASSPFVVGQSAKSVAFLHKPPCPGSGVDC